MILDNLRVHLSLFMVVVALLLGIVRARTRSLVLLPAAVFVLGGGLVY